jgi:hypothetical protein
MTKKKKLADFFIAKVEHPIDYRCDDEVKALELG